MAIESVTIRDEKSGAAAKILVGFGFNCYSLQVMHDGRPLEVLWSAPGLENGGQRPSGSGIPILFPFPGRIRGTQLQWQGKSYSLKEGDGRGNAIHGFVHERPWRVIEQTGNRVVGQFQASVDDPRLLDCWPADFRITAEYEIVGNELKGTYTIDNPSDRPLPFGLGTHPYFRVPLGGNNAAECIVRVPVSEKWELRDMIVTGRQQPCAERQQFRDGMKFGDTAFDNVFSGLDFVDGKFTGSIQDPTSGRQMIMQFGREFPYCVVYNPPHREAICIEPYSCLPDPFRLTAEGIESGLRVLSPGESHVATADIRIE